MDILQGKNFVTIIKFPQSYSNVFERVLLHKKIMPNFF